MTAVPIGRRRPQVGIHTAVAVTEARSGPALRACGGRVGAFRDR